MLGLKGDGDSENFLIAGAAATLLAFQADSSRKGTGLTLKEGSLAIGAELFGNVE